MTHLHVITNHDLVSSGKTMFGRILRTIMFSNKVKSVVSTTLENNEVYRKKVCFSKSPLKGQTYKTVKVFCLNGKRSIKTSLDIMNLNETQRKDNLNL